MLDYSATHKKNVKTKTINPFFFQTLLVHLNKNYAYYLLIQQTQKQQQP